MKEKIHRLETKWGLQICEASGDKNFPLSCLEIRAGKFNGKTTPLALRILCS
jgi:hypothetical protein